MDGLLLVDKPSGWTSFDVVAKVRGTLRKAQSTERRVQSPELSAHRSQPSARASKVRVGHTGTLDPLATGLLVLVLGNYCKRAQEFSKLDKTYEVKMRLGETSTTGDGEGEKQVTSTQVPSDKEVEAALQGFTGEIMQTPPMYSAIKVNGQRAYKLARAGKEVKLEPRQVTICKAQVTSYAYPDVKFTATVSSGTYIRSLVEDIGQKIGTGAYMSALCRTEVGEFSLKDALTMDKLTAETIYSELLARD